MTKTKATLPEEIAAMAEELGCMQRKYFEKGAQAMLERERRLQKRIAELEAELAKLQPKFGTTGDSVDVEALEGGE